MALKSDGSVWTWGYNNAGQLGDSSTGSTDNTGGSDSPVQVVGPGGSGTLANAIAVGAGPATSDAFALVPPPPQPVVTTVNPSSGPATGGTQVTITGSGFTGATAVNFGNTAVTNGISVHASGTQITVTSPPGVDVVDVTVTTPGGMSTTSAADQFSFVPVATSVNPASGPAFGGTQVTIGGAGFTGATKVNFVTRLWRAASRSTGPARRSPSTRRRVWEPSTSRSQPWAGRARRQTSSPISQRRPSPASARRQVPPSAVRP